MTKVVGYPLWNLSDFVNEILCHLPNLHSLDLGMESSFYLPYWELKMIQAPLIYLKISLGETQDLIAMMSTKPLSYT